MKPLNHAQLTEKAGEVVGLCEGLLATDVLWILGWTIRFILSRTAHAEQRQEWIAFTLQTAGIEAADKADRWD